MFHNRISGTLEMAWQPQPTPSQPVPPSIGSLADLLGMTASTRSLYQAAAAQAARDHELNKLFNPEHYGLADDDATDFDSDE